MRITCPNCGKVGKTKTQPKLGVICHCPACEQTFKYVESQSRYWQADEEWSRLPHYNRTELTMRPSPASRRAGFQSWAAIGLIMAVGLGVLRFTTSSSEGSDSAADNQSRDEREAKRLLLGQSVLPTGDRRAIELPTKTGMSLQSKGGESLSRPIAELNRSSGLEADLTDHIAREIDRLSDTLKADLTNEIKREITREATRLQAKDEGPISPRKPSTEINHMTADETLLFIGDENAVPRRRELLSQASSIGFRQNYKNWLQKDGERPEDVRLVQKGTRLSPLKLINLASKGYAPVHFVEVLTERCIKKEYPRAL